MKNLLKTFCSVAMLTVFTSSPQLAIAENNFDGLLREDFGSLQYSFAVAEGWSAEKLSRAMLYAHEIGSSAVVMLHQGKLVL